LYAVLIKYKLLIVYIHLYFTISLFHESKSSMLVDHKLQDLIHTAQWIDQRQWCPATGGNFSLRIAEQIYITASGKHKGHLQLNDFLTINDQGDVLATRASGVKPSAETAVHTALYRLDPKVECVLHTHSVNSTILSLLTLEDHLAIQGLEMQKSLTGNTTHVDRIKLAIFDNTQDMQFLAQHITKRWEKEPLQWGLLVRGHGLYAWGHSLAETKRHLEGIEFLLSCILQLKSLS
jgi:methylthioribulose-1-phosphate dehydratase